MQVTCYAVAAAAVKSTVHLNVVIGPGVPQGCDEVISVLVRHKADADIAHS